MNEISNIDLSNLVEKMFSQKLQLHFRILQEIRNEIEGRQNLHNQILETIDKQISNHGTRLREMETRFQNDATLWLHPRRTQIEAQLSEWHKQRLHHQTTAWEHIQRLRQRWGLILLKMMKGILTVVIVSSIIINQRVLKGWFQNEQQKVF